MIGYVTLGSNDIPRAAEFYDALLAEIGAGRMMEGETFVAWATGPGQPAISVIKPNDGNMATVGNGTMVALVMDSKEKVDRLYNKAMQLGAKCEGAPGARSHDFYAAYFRDSDGNKLCVFYWG